MTTSYKIQEKAIIKFLTVVAEHSYYGQIPVISLPEIEQKKFGRLLINLQLLIVKA